MDLSASEALKGYLIDTHRIFQQVLIQGRIYYGLIT